MSEPAGWAHADHPHADSLDRPGDLSGCARYQMVLM